MKTIIHKSEGRFSSFNIFMENITDVDLIEKIIRAAEDNDNISFTEYEKGKISVLFTECKQITKVEQNYPF